MRNLETLSFPWLQSQSSDTMPSNVPLGRLPHLLCAYSGRVSRLCEATAGKNYPECCLHWCWRGPKWGHITDNIFAEVQEAGVITNSTANGRVITREVPAVTDLC